TSLPGVYSKHHYPFRCSRDDLPGCSLPSLLVCPGSDWCSALLDHDSSAAEFARMAKSRGDLTESLVRNNILSADQLEEARGIAQQSGAKIADTLVKLGYCTTDQVMHAVADFNGMQFVNLTDVTIPPAVIELVPESVARENVVLPYTQDGAILKIV